jgi:hypothetical protein
MKSLTRIFVALLLAVGITFGSFHSNAHAAPPLPVPSISINPDTTFDKIVSPIRFERKYTVIVANKTGKTLERVGAYNDYKDSSNWPLGDIAPNTAVGQQFDGNPYNGSFSFASNYRVEPGKNIQLAATYPIIGSRKIALGGINQDGNGPAKETWDGRTYGNDKSLNNPPLEAYASIKQKDGSLIWYYEVK